jgi:hypothetical protein
VLLSHNAAEASPFVGAGLEMIFWRLFGLDTKFEFFVTADDRHYLSARSTDKEQTAFSLVQIKKSFSERLYGTMAAEYLYQDQILDVSATEANLQTVRVRGHTIIARPTVRHDSGESWLELQLPVQRQYLDQPLDDYWEANARLVWGFPFGNKSEFTVAYEFGRRWYDHDESLAADGSIMPGTHREFRQQEARLAWRQNWDRKRRWRTTTRATARINQDNGSGYFDYLRGQFSEQVRYAGDKWDVQAEVKVSRYDFPLQTASAADLSRRWRTEAEFSLRCERKMAKSLKIFADYSHERTLANRSIEEYSVNTVSGGLNWDF